MPSNTYAETPEATSLLDDLLVKNKTPYNATEADIDLATLKRWARAHDPAKFASPTY